MSTTAGPSDKEKGPAIPAVAAASLLTSFTSFLTIAIHSLLYHRNLYPAASFLTARAYNLPVHQSRHPRVCSWVQDAVAAVAAQLHIGAARRVVFVVHGVPPALHVLERWVFDVQSFPAWGQPGDRIITAAVEVDDDAVDDDEGYQVDQPDSINWTDVNEALRGALGRIAYAAQGMEPLPNGCTFTLALELRNEAPAPIGHPQPWIPSEANLQPPTKTKPHQGSSLGGASTTPIRSVRADPLFFECWVEQGSPDPGADNDSTPTPKPKNKKASSS